MTSLQADVLIIGGGAGGLSIASGLSQLGLATVLINNESSMGGDCLHYGCVPSKTLIHVANTVHAAKNAQQYGITCDAATIAPQAIFGAVQNVIDMIQPHDSIERFESMGIRVLIGEPTFLDPHTIQLDDSKIQARYIVIATGSSPSTPPIPGLDQIQVLNNESLFKLNHLPKHLAIIGGGAIGCEIAQAMARLGVKVSLLEGLTQILPFLDPDMAELIAKRFHDESIQITTHAKITKIEKQGDNLSLHYALNDTTHTLECDELLIAAGRRPNIDKLALDSIGIKYDRQGIDIDARCRTNYKHIFAIGDVAKTPLKFTHHAEFQAGIVLQNIAFRIPKKALNPFVPACVYTDPEVAIIGMSEKEASEKLSHIHVESLPFSKIDRALTDENTYGMGKLILHRKKLVGVTIVGPRAGDLISEWRYVLNKKLSLADVASNIHPYPNYAQWNKRITGQYYGKMLFSGKMKKLVRFLHGKWF